MSHPSGRQYLAIPGPSVMPDAVLRAMHRAAPNIYEGELIEMTAGLIPDLRDVARTAHDVAFYIGNGHAAWEAALANTVPAGARVLVPATGRFGHGWADVARGRGIDVQMEDFGKSTPLDPARVEQVLRDDTGGQIRAVLATHVDTSSTLRNDLAALRKAIDAAGHPALLMADCIASLACDRFEMDAWGVDVAVAASQKGLMVPPGLGFVFFGPRADDARRRMDRVSRYWDWAPRANPESFYQYSGGTAPTHHLYGLRAALDMIRAEGMEAIWTRHAVLARAIWAAAEAWSEGGPLRLNVADRAHRSHAVTALRLEGDQGTALRRWVQDNAGLTLGIGLGMAEPGDPAWHSFFRMGHMGHVNAHMVLGALGSIQAGLVALDIPHGRGGLEAASAEIAAITA
ncbi:pyridoxal-phosphate-dependent aminotransferase family protein [Sediminimonas qiaohouensis]|uniref:pyridoxal-phosphate-dependent aminotransferase family protein n=1 Tax=Sediminimonas qiaohouensis TaxID=552061 RepID=UPI00047EC2E3|nr:aminotransferase class V-fold PLP-dependent enzyme [Sediminimonas qiaohouensis]